MEAKAIARKLRVSPIRARLVEDMIRGKSTSEALNILSKATKDYFKEDRWPDD